MDIISRKYINEGFNSKAYIINDDYILLDGVNQNSYKNYQKYVNVINQISNVKSLEIPRIIELIEPCEEYPNGALIYKMIKGHTFRKEHIEIVNLDNIAKKLAEFMDELYEIRVDFDKDEYIKNELEITEQSVIELKEYLSESNYEKILSWFNEYKNYLLTFNDYHFIHGDLWYENYILNDNNELVGKYIADIENLEITKEPLNIGYKEFRPEFYEWIYIPYTEIDKEIEVDKNRRKIATSILDYINKYGNGQYNLETTAKNKNNRISTLAISIENNNAQVEKRILKSIIENNNEVEIQNIGKELLKKIDECMFEQVTRSCKFELDAKLENDVSEDQFINEMYKKIVEKLKLDNVKDIKTINKKTEIIFESSEKLDIESNGKDRMDDYIKNSKLIKENSQSQENISKDKLKEEIIKEEEEVL